jgi:hypothetical protein
MENLISHMADKEYTLKFFEDTSDAVEHLRRLTLEFCHTFNTRCGFAAHINPNGEVGRLFGRTLRVFTPEGVPCGSLKVVHGEDGYYYIYSGPQVRKEKASARTDKFSRDSNKISGLINAIKRNNETPTANQTINNSPIKEGARYALGVMDHSRSLYIDLKHDAVAELVKAFLGQSNAAEGYRADIEEAYSKHQTASQEINESKLNLRRFMEGGFKVVAIHKFDSDVRPMYVVADGTAEDVSTSGIHITNARGVLDFSDDPDLQATAMMSRTYLQGTGRFDDSNLFGLPMGDVYHGDIDISTGYSRAEWLTVLIPKKAP